MKTRIIGDVHANLDAYMYICTEGGFDGPTIQVGDFGVGFYSDYWHEKASNFGKSGKHRFIRGNHDNPDRCKTMPGWIEDGTVENDIMFIGGAWSIDYYRRIEGLNWWRDEELSVAQLNEIYDTYVKVKPRVVITHDGPTKVTEEMFIKAGLALGGPGARVIPTRTGEALQAMIEQHQPEMFFFGHWHHTMKYMYNGTMFQCIGELDYVDVDL